MICTEEEARRKWCPNVKFLISPEKPPWNSLGYTNRAEYFDHKGTCCIGSDCMWWIWTSSEQEKGYCAQGGG